MQSARRTFLCCLLKDYAFPFRALQISWVMVPIGQYTHQLRGLNSTMVISPRTVEVSITL